MKRRALISLLGSRVIVPTVATAQNRTYRVGLLTPTAPLEPAAPPAKFLLDVLAQRGYRLGDNLTVTTRAAYRPGGHYAVTTGATPRPVQADPRGRRREMRSRCR